MTIYANRTELANGTRVSFAAVDGIHAGGTGVVLGGHPGEPKSWVSVLCDFDLEANRHAGGRYMAVSALTPIETPPLTYDEAKVIGALQYGYQGSHATAYAVGYLAGKDDDALSLSIFIGEHRPPARTGYADAVNKRYHA